MKTILMALIVAGFTHYNADAQSGKVACGKPEGKVCKRSPNNGRSCYKTKYAENFKVCKGNYGYYICCERPGYANSTHPKLPMTRQNTYLPENPSAMNTNNVPGQTYPWMNDENARNTNGANNTTSYE